MTPLGARTENINIRVTADEKELIKKAAHSLKLRPSEYARDIVLVAATSRLERKRK